MPTVAGKAIYTFLNLFKRDLAKRIYITFGVYDFFNIHIFSWYKALYSASRSTFRHLDFILKTDSYIFINTWNTEFYIPLLLRQSKSRYRYDID